MILKAMLAVGRKGIPSGCHGGGCGVCKVKVLSGEYRTGTMSREHVSEEDEQQGIALACQVYPRTDLTVKVLGEMRKAVTAGRRYSFV
jgi:ferredoxin